MPLIFKLALRNLFRHRRRTILTGLTILGGYVLCALSLALTEGSYADIIGSFTSDHTGHVQIHAGEYLENPSLQQTIEDISQIRRVLEETPGVDSWAPRIFSAAMAFNDKKTTGVRLIGIDPEREAETTRIRTKVSEGSYLEANSGDGALVGYTVARMLGIGLGDELVLISQGADGSIANDIFTLTGILGKTASSTESGNVYLGIGDMKRFLSFSDAAHEVAISLHEVDDARAVASSIQSRLPPQVNDPPLAVDPWQVVEEDFYRAMQADRQGNFVTMGIIIFIVALGVLNTVLMALLERMREFGILKALGTRPLSIIGLVLLEVSVLCAACVAAGSALAYSGGLYFKYNGIDLGEPVEISGIVMEEMTADPNAWSLILPALVICISALFVSLYPAVRAARAPAVNAMRRH